VVTVIVGLGKTGLSCVRYLQRCYPDRILRVLDSRENCPGAEAFRQQYPHIPLYCGNFRESAFANASYVILSPGVNQWAPQIKEWVGSQVAVTGDLDIFAAAIADKGVECIGVTGSNGKSTVTTLVGEILKSQGKKVAVGGNLGTPALDLLPSFGEAWPELFVLELSSFQLAITEYLPLRVATVLNLSPDHLDYHGSEHEYAMAKCRIFKQADIAVVNKEASNLKTYLPASIPSIGFGLFQPENAHDFGLSEDASGKTWLCRGKQRLLRRDDLKISGTHNVANVLASLALVSTVSQNPDSIDWDPILQAVRAFGGLPHRCQWVREISGVQWINDSKGTNVGATEQALLGLGDSIAGKWVLLAGGDGKGADFQSLIPPLKRHVKAVVLIGKDKKIMEAAFKETVPCQLCSTLEEAVLACQRLAEPGDGVLLSPACASLDMFAHYEERGNLFMQQVKDLN
jgi:UDP-N-acetylmuramoylalanine--D-glutamate ligase